MTAAIANYKASDRYLAMKPKTRANYLTELNRIPSKTLALPIAEIERSLLVRLTRVVAKNSKRRGIELAKVLNLVFQNALDEGLINAPAPCSLDNKLPNPVGYKAEPWEEWPEEDIELFLAKASPIWRRALVILLYTGLRREDAVNLTRDHIKDGFIEFATSKAEALGKGTVDVTIPIQLHDRLTEELSKPLMIPGKKTSRTAPTGELVPAVTPFLICGTRGHQIRGDVLYHAIQEEAKRIGIDAPKTVHGPRRNAVMHLLELGLSEEDIHVITGQSKTMIRHYGARFRRRKVAEGILLKLPQKDEPGT